MNFIRNLGTTELIIIGFVLLMLFGRKKLSEWAQGLGESGRELKEVKKEFDDVISDTQKKQPLEKKSTSEEIMKKLENKSNDSKK